MNDLSSLISRVEKATGPDRTIDVDVMNLLCPRQKDEAFLVLGKQLQAKWGGVGEIANKTTYFVEAPRLTTSVDAAISLAERVLLGNPDQSPADIVRQALRSLSDEHWWHVALYQNGQLSGLARHIVLATLRAIQSQKGEA